MIYIYVDAVAESERNPVRKHQTHQPECGDEQANNGTGRPNLSRETKFSGANGDGGKIISLLLSSLPRTSRMIVNLLTRG